ncbi:MAG TPA: Mur ligase family protein [Steroidobacteraceae bacterium]|nr:Mur ligase family protein [Steroidobacteraceae bacterium]
MARAHATGVSLALAAPCDQLFVATEINEWALCASLAARDPACTVAFEAALLAEVLEDAADPATVIPPVLEESQALARFATLAAREAQPRLMALLAAAAERGLPHVLDATVLTLGAGSGGRDFPLQQLPAADAVPWRELHDIPTAIVTGSNGKTTTVRLVAACARAHGWPSAFCCTDGVFFEGTAAVSGDYSGPEGARRVMRERRAHAAIVETARGGILRRGLAISQARVAVVTNVSADHFGEYGIDDLAGLADVKLALAGVVTPAGLLVLNAGDAQLAAKAPLLAQRFGRCPPLGWFALDAEHACLRAHRARGGATCGVHEGRLQLHHFRRDHDLGSVAAMPLTVEGSASYNIANLAAAALAASALGVPAAVIAGVFARFGAHAGDNPGRMMRFERDGVRILVDYAHNPEGMQGLMRVANYLRRPGGRLGTVLGQAGNRQNSDIEALARCVAQFRPDFVVIKEDETYLRGRAPGEVPRLIHATLRSAGLPDAALAVRMTELEAVRCALAWARPGDVLALPVHAPASRVAVLAMLDGEGT